jgi:hypothetical protein
MNRNALNYLLTLAFSPVTDKGYKGNKQPDDIYGGRRIGTIIGSIDDQTQTSGRI